MSKEKRENPEKKVVTKYDRKMEERRKQQEKEKRNQKILRISSIAILICLVAAIGFSIVNSVLNRKRTLSDIYVKVGEHQLTKLEYDYYSDSVVNNYLSSYGAILPYMGLDTTKDFADQQYTDTMTWKDFFDQMAVQQITEVKAMADDAAAKGFVYDDAEDYAAYMEQLKAGADNAGVSLSKYIKSIYGDYATESRLEPFARETLLAAAYYESLMEQNKPSQEEVEQYYQENKQDYDTIDYKSFAVTADAAEDASEEEIAAAMEKASAAAEEMKERREAGEKFEVLCKEFANEEQAADYEDPSEEKALTLEGSYSSMSSSYADWLYEEARQAGDVTVVEDSVNNQYYVVEFVGRNADAETAYSSISDTLANEKATEYVNGLIENYEVTDVAGELVYLTIPEETEESASQEESTEEGTAETQSE